VTRAAGITEVLAVPAAVVSIFRQPRVIGGRRRIQPYWLAWRTCRSSQRRHGAELAANQTRTFDFATFFAKRKTITATQAGVWKNRLPN